MSKSSIASLLALLMCAMLLGGCAAPALIGAGTGAGGFTAGWFANPGNDLAVFNTALKADAPLKMVWCIDHWSSLPAPVLTYCQNIPTSADQVPVTLLKVISAEMDHGKTQP